MIRAAHRSGLAVHVWTIDEPAEMRAEQPWAYNWSAAPAFDRASCQELAEGLLRELTRMGVTKPMRFIPGANALG